MAKIEFSPQLVDSIKALAGESRIQILLLFTDARPRTVNEIASAIDLGQSTTSEHLALLKRVGILLSERQGKEVYYRPDVAYIQSFLKELSNTLERCCRT